ncbi:hypothetical protein OAH18_00695 [bacterium]|nr:hypothetical protein [bacterium]
MAGIHDGQPGIVGRPTVSAHQHKIKTIGCAAMGKKFRKKKLVNKQLQGQLMLKMVFHWLGYNAVVISMTLSSVMFVYVLTAVNGVPENTMKEEFFGFFARHRPMLIAMLLLLPIVVWDMLKTTHRVAGPVYKFRSELQHYIDTGEMRSVKLRDNDFLTEFQDTWNQAVARHNGGEVADAARTGDVIPPSPEAAPATSSGAESPTMAS